MKVTPKQYARALYESLEGISKEKESEVVENFLKILSENNQCSQLEKILSHFKNIWNKENNIIEAEVITARPLDNSDLKKVENVINSRVGNKKVEIEYKIDENILGGFIVRIGDEVLDASIKNRLFELNKKLKN